MSACAIRAHLAEFGIIAPQGRHRVDQLAAYLEGEEGKHVPLLARETLRLLIDQLGDLSGRIATLEAELAKLHRIHPIAQLLSTIPGVGPITSTALVATVPDPSVFRSGREFAAWIGLTPRQNSSGGKERLGRITKRGDVLRLSNRMYVELLPFSEHDTVGLNVVILLASHRHLPNKRQHSATHAQLH